MTRHALVVLALLAIAPATARGQTPTGAAPDDSLASAVAVAAKTAQPAEQPALLTYANRRIVEFRASVLSRTPAARAAAVVTTLNRLVDQAPNGRVASRAYSGGILMVIDDHPVFVVYAADVDPLTGESLDSKAAGAAASLQTAFTEAVVLRNPFKLLRAASVALAATVLYVAALWLLVRLDRRVAARMSLAAERHLRRFPGAEIIAGVAQAPMLVRRAFTLGGILLGLLVTYSWLGIVFRRFPYTRPWGES